MNVFLEVIFENGIEGTKWRIRFAIVFGIFFWAASLVFSRVVPQL